MAVAGRGADDGCALCMSAVRVVVAVFLFLFLLSVVVLFVVCVSVFQGIERKSFPPF